MELDAGVGPSGEITLYIREIPGDLLIINCTSVCDHSIALVKFEFLVCLFKMTANRSQHNQLPDSSSSPPIK